MDTSDPGITFDEKGVCNHCHIYEKQTQYLYSKEDLKKEIKQIKEEGRGKKYDCIIGLSGGVDSSMVAYFVKKIGLNPLAVHLDNGWNSELSVKNIESLVRKLNIDLYTWVVNWEEFKNLQLSFFKASVPNIEIPTDHAIRSSLYKMAVKWNVRHIIHGGNINSEAIMPDSWGYKSMDLKYIKSIHRKFGKTRLKTIPQLSIWKLTYYSLVKKIKRFPILDYLDYNKEESKKFLIEELGWENYGGKHEESIFTRFFQNYILPKKFGIDKRRAHLSSLINSGQISRKEALKEIEKPIAPEEQNKRDKEFVMKKWGLEEKEFNKIMSLPVKSYKDYPNDSLFIDRLSFLYRGVKKIIKS